MTSNEEIQSNGHNHTLKIHDKGTEQPKQTFDCSFITQCCTASGHTCDRFDLCQMIKDGYFLYDRNIIQFIFSILFLVIGKKKELYILLIGIYSLWHQLQLCFNYQNLILIKL